jgi:hypothetical protein
MFLACGFAFPEDGGSGRHRIMPECNLCKYFLNCYKCIVLDEFVDNNLSIKTLIFIN